uniref:amine sulfotransferase-like isoform X1 n=1 Tax=Styela clava TaxID=7725 RepID=UPI001939530B|nr:amine sulfotransferase-like isoform X1 [Styela clava]
MDSLPDDIKIKIDEVNQFMNNWKLKPQTWKNIRGIAAFSMDAAKYAYRNWEPRKGDVFIVTYPKCGTHWMYEVIKQIYFIRDSNWLDFLSPKSGGFLSKPIYLDHGPKAKFEVMDHFTRPRIFTTHLPEELVNFEKIVKNDAKVIYLYRNPKDMVTSYFHFKSSYPSPPELAHLRTDNFDKFYKQLINGEMWTHVPEGEWYPYHIKSWLKHKNENCVKFLSYEDMKKDFHVVVKSICDFLEVERNETEIAEIVKRCSITYMRKSNEGEEKMFYRKGDVGDWKNHFTVSQSEIMDDHLKIAMKDVDIEFQYVI